MCELPMKATLLSLGVILLLVFCCFLININKLTNPLSFKDQETLEKEIQYSYSLINTKNKVLSKAEIWFYAPALKTSFQDCLSLKSSFPYERIVDKFGNQIIHLTLTNIPPFSTKIVHIKSNLRTYSYPKKIELLDFSLFLQPEAFIQSDNPEIVQLAKTLQSKDPLQTVSNIFNWIANKIQYVGYVKNERGALHALQSKKGVCTEFAYLFVALCRANGIPAKPIGGYICKDNCIVKSEQYHNWANFYHDGAWHLADPQKKVFMDNATQYIAMKQMGKISDNPSEDFQRLRVIGEGLNVRMN